MNFVQSKIRENALRKAIKILRQGMYVPSKGCNMTNMYMSQNFSII